jgi:hypothetical protein
VKFGLDKRAVAVTRAVEDLKGYRAIKAPKTARGVRAFRIDESLADLLKVRRDKQKQLVAGVPDGVEVDLGLVKLAPDALLFPGDDGTKLTKLRCGCAVSRPFKRGILKLGFPTALRLLDLRGSHKTVLLTMACRCTSLPNAAGMTRRCCSRATPSERLRPPGPLPRSSERRWPRR